MLTPPRSPGGSTSASAPPGSRRTALNKVFPDHWSFMIGELALYCFVVLVLTGVYLTFFFDAERRREVVYDGSYEPLRGVEMTEAYRSALDLSFDVRAGLVMRQMHHWAALLFLAAIVVHLARVFFTGAFRRPRELNWMIGVTLLILAIFNGFAGYSLLDDQLSGTGLRIAYSIALSIPVVGTWMASLVFGGEFPGDDIIARLYVIHILLIPAAIVVLLGAHLAVARAPQAHAVPGPGARARTTSSASGCGRRTRPRRSACSSSPPRCSPLLGGVAQINPIWIYGPFDPRRGVAPRASPTGTWAGSTARCGSCRGGRSAPSASRSRTRSSPACCSPASRSGCCTLWPFLEARFTRRPRRAPPARPAPRPPAAHGARRGDARFYVVLFLGGGADVLSATFGVSVNAGVLDCSASLLFVAAAVTGCVPPIASASSSTARDPVEVDSGPGRLVDWASEAGRAGEQQQRGRARHEEQHTEDQPVGHEEGADADPERPHAGVGEVRLVRLVRLGVGPRQPPLPGPQVAGREP